MWRFATILSFAVVAVTYLALRTCVWPTPTQLDCLTLLYETAVVAILFGAGGVGLALMLVESLQRRRK